MCGRRSSEAATVDFKEHWLGKILHRKDKSKRLPTFWPSQLLGGSPADGGAQLRTAFHLSEIPRKHLRENTAKAAELSRGPGVLLHFLLLQKEALSAQLRLNFLRYGG